MARSTSLLFFLLCGYALSADAQVRFSLATDLSVLRHLGPEATFWAIGQTVQGHAHLTDRDAAYAWLHHFTPGRDRQTRTATARDLATVPATISYTRSTNWNFRHVSVGWRRYLRGSAVAEEGLSIYGQAGFGLLLAGVRHEFIGLDTARYAPGVEPGPGTFRRLTFDLGLGAEYPLRGNLFLYTDIRTWLPASTTPSPFVPEDAGLPRPLLVNGGIRIMFEY